MAKILVGKRHPGSKRIHPESGWLLAGTDWNCLDVVVTLRVEIRDNRHSLASIKVS